MVDPPGISFQETPGFRVEDRQALFRRAPETDGQSKAIRIQKTLAQDFRQSARHPPAGHVHLPETVLGLHIALGECDLITCRTLRRTRHA